MAPRSRGTPRSPPSVLGVAPANLVVLVLLGSSVYVSAAEQPKIPQTLQQSPYACTPPRLAYSRELRWALTGRHEACLGLTPLDLSITWPRLPSLEGFTAFAATDLRVSMEIIPGQDDPRLLGNFSLCTGQSVCNSQSINWQSLIQRHRECTPRSTELRLGMFKLPMEAWGTPGSSPPPREEQGCTYTFDTPVVVYSRVTPKNHLGHRMLTDLPALWGLRKYLEEMLGISASSLPIVYIDHNGDPAWGADNFQKQLEAMGFKSFHTNALRNATWCAHQAIILGTNFWLKKHVDKKGRHHYLWDRPDMLWDTDTTTIAAIEAVRQAAGLEPTMPWAPLHPQRVVFASRDPLLRVDAKQVAKRQFLNEGVLAKRLRDALGPAVEVEQIEFSTLDLKGSIQKLESASILIGYHGAALDLNFWLPRGACLIELMPSGSTHEPLYPSKAALSGKQFIGWASDDMNTQVCQVVGRGCPNATRSQMHNADMEMKPEQIEEIVKMVTSVLTVQQYTLRRHPFHWGGSTWEDVKDRPDEITASKIPPRPRD